MMSYREIETRVEDGVSLIILNRPQKRNAYTPDMGEELVHAMRAAARGADVHALIVTGAGSAFCAGADRDFLAGKKARNGKRLGEEEFIAGFTAELAVLPLLTIAAINGAAAGIGVTATLAMDLRIAAEDAPLLLNFAELGILPGLGASCLLPRLVGEGRARELLLCQRRIAGRDAARCGLVNRAVPAEQVLPAARELAASAAACKPGMIGGIKRALAADGALERALAAEKRLAEELQS